MVVVDGHEISYRALAGRLVMKSEDGKPKAAVFFVAYLRKDVGDLSRRASDHLVQRGARRVVGLAAPGAVGPAAGPGGRCGAATVPALSAWSTTNSRFWTSPTWSSSTRSARATAGRRPDEEAKQFHGLEPDIESVGEFIRLFVTRYQRWGSPKFLIGESYGTTRAAGLAGHLQQRHGMSLNGLMLISAVLNFQTVEFEPGNDLPYVLFLPTYAATAWYHGLLPAGDQFQLHDIISEAESFAEGEYHRALFQGAALPAAQRAAVVETLARLTGLAPAYLERTNLRVEIFRFTKELLRGRRRTVGRLDGRFVGSDRDAAGERPEHDPSYTAVQGAYTGAFNAYVRQDLNFASDLPYEVLSALYENWDFSKHQNRYVDVSETLRAAMTQNPFLRVLIASGYYDLATPYFATRYTVNHLGLEQELQGNIRLTYYEAGHMMYVHEPSLAQLRADLAGFVQETLSAGA